MFQFTKTVVATALSGAALLLGGCASHENAGPNAMMDMSSTSTAMTCDKCETTWVKTPVTGSGPHGNGTTITGFRNSSKMVCSECKGAVENMFATGKMEHTCTACGGNMTGCAVVK